MFQRFIDYMLKKEPAVISGALVSGFGTLFGLLVLWQVPLSQAYQNAIITTIPALVSFVMGVAVLIRHLVTPTPKAEQAIANAVMLDKPVTPAELQAPAVQPKQILKTARP